MTLRPPPPRLRPDWGGALLGAVAIVLGSAAVGIAVNHFRPHRLPIVQRAEPGRPTLPSGLAAISATEARAAWGAKAAPFLDARAAREYARGHIPGALSLPVADFEKRFLDLADRLEGAPQIIVYCDSADCGEAVELGQRLREGYQGRILVLVDGWRGWTEAGYPVTRGAAP